MGQLAKYSLALIRRSNGLLVLTGVISSHSPTRCYNKHKMSAQRIRDYVVKHWQNIATYGTLFSTLTIVLVWRLGSLVHGYSSGEAHTYAAAQTMHGLLGSPLNAPFL